MNSTLDEQAPLKRINKYKLKFKSKPWITRAIQKSITFKNNLLKSFINAKDSQTFVGNIKITGICYLHYSKLKHQYFKANMNNIKNTWEGIKSIITIKNLSSDTPKSLFSNGSTITNHVEISNVFNKYFATITEKTKENINPSCKHFSDFLMLWLDSHLYLQT